MTFERLLVALPLFLAFSLIGACDGSDPLPLRRQLREPTTASASAVPAEEEGDEGAPAATFAARLALEGSPDGSVDTPPVEPASCRTWPSSAACHVCCLDANPAAVAIEREAFRDCACGSVAGGQLATCSNACGADYCSGAAPPSAACLTCIDGLRTTCEALVTARCAASPACAALDTCIAQSGCATKP